MKYQFCIRFSNVDVNSAASKAVLDCNALFQQQGYRDFTFTAGDNTNRFRYYALLLKNLIVFFFSIKRGSVVGVQYPLLSINNVFKYFIKTARLKKTTFFCIVHDLISLRTGGKNEVLIRKEISNLNMFDRVIVHNRQMLDWLQENGLKTEAVILGVFDYLTDNSVKENPYDPQNKMIVYAGNLIKSRFIYGLKNIRHSSFNLYGPGYEASSMQDAINVKWVGQYSPEKIAGELRGDFGLIWDGESCESCDELLGNYLRYNAPHKFSLYIAAGLPVIAPADSAIGFIIKSHQIGVLLNNLSELEELTVSNEEYSLMRKHVLILREGIVNGRFFTQTLVEIDAAVA